MRGAIQTISFLKGAHTVVATVLWQFSILGVGEINTALVQLAAVVLLLLCLVQPKTSDSTSASHSYLLFPSHSDGRRERRVQF